MQRTAVVVSVSENAADPFRQIDQQATGGQSLLNIQRQNLEGLDDTAHIDDGVQLVSVLPSGLPELLENDPELGRIVTVWPALPEPVKRAIMALLEMEK